MRYHGGMAVEEPSAQELDTIREKGLRPEVVGCFVSNKKLLFVHDEEWKIWQIPQGGIEPGETPSETLNREMHEELGENFVNKCDKCIVIGRCALMGEDHIYFSTSKVVKTSDGREIPMTGKEYFFYAIETPSQDLNIKETEFNRHAWLPYEKAVELAEGISQKGKQKITKEAVGLLKQNNFL
jgi:8-oxo-dGTP pyrophosphatase MutT (NUDIX family)